jgi:hypothetical protein
MDSGPGSLGAAEDITGDGFKTIGNWLPRAGEHASELTGSAGASSGVG